MGCLALPLITRLPTPGVSLAVWNHWGKLSLVSEPEPGEGPVLATVEYKISPEMEAAFLDAIHEFERIRRRDGATRWGIFYDAEMPGTYLESFLVDSWAEHLRQHDRFTLADREPEDRVLRFVLNRSRLGIFSMRSVPKTMADWLGSF